MINLKLWPAAILLLACVLSAGSDSVVNSLASVEPGERLSGGETTVAEDSRNAFSLPVANIPFNTRGNFFAGNAFFRDPWVIAPSSTRGRDGLGPLYNLNSCQGCHVKDGRGRPPAPGKVVSSILVRLSLAASNPLTDTQKALLLTQGALPEPYYGNQNHPFAIPGNRPDPMPVFEYQEIPGRFLDGDEYILRQPSIRFELIQDAPPLHSETLMSARVAPSVIGMGLLEAIPEKDILNNADPVDINADGISGRANHVWDHNRKETVVGRFGWKANQPNVSQQTAAAFHDDIGITSRLFTGQPCTALQTDCLNAPKGGDPDFEISDKIFALVVSYVKRLAVPARRNADSPVVLRGKKLFHEAQCANCHIPAFVTGVDEEFPELSNQTIRPYTDLLLHDMGDGLADGRPDFEASGREWRTPPLWGIGLVKIVNEHELFLHDGRARGLMEAILWHDGEAAHARDSVLAMQREDRQALLAFLNSL